MGQFSTVGEAVEAFLQEVEGVVDHGSYHMAFCPSHEDRKKQSLSIRAKEDGMSLKCFGGCSSQEILEAVGWELKHLYPKDSPNGKAMKKSQPQPQDENVVSIDEARLRGQVAAVEAGLGCTLKEYAQSKGLDPGWLEQHFGLSELKYHSKTKAPAVSIPYYDENQQEIRLRYRSALKKSEDGPDRRFLWQKGSKADVLYGLERLPKIRKTLSKSVILVEGESDVHTLWWHGYAALGIPGASNYQAIDPETFEGLEHIYLIVEQGDAAQNLAEKVGEILGEEWWPNLHLISLGKYDDPSELHLDTLEVPGRFEEIFRAAMDTAISYEEVRYQEDNEEALDAWSQCQDLAYSEDILTELTQDLKKAGVVGQERETKLLYLASTTRYLDRPSSVVVKGPSGSGKTFVVMKVLEFHPPDGSYSLTAMSERALAYGHENLSHRHLVIYEATAMEGSDMLSYLLRSLLSEGHIKYEFVDTSNSGPPEVVTVEREGPTGLFVTTTEQSLHPENETRMLSITMNDTQEQTSAIMLARAQKKKNSGPDLTRWHTLQTWIRLAGTHEVNIPYAEWLARKIPPIAVRLRRDFEQLLNLVAAHAILYQAQRERNNDGEIIAETEDYRVIRELLNDLISELLESSTSKIVRETVEEIERAYERLESKSDGVTLRHLAENLSLDKSSASRRVNTAIEKGFVKNLEDRKGRPARYAPADDLPKDIVVLPDPAEIPEDPSVTVEPWNQSMADQLLLETMACRSSERLGGSSESVTLEDAVNDAYSREDMYGLREACAALRTSWQTVAK